MFAYTCIFNNKGRCTGCCCKQPYLDKRFSQVTPPTHTDSPHDSHELPFLHPEVYCHLLSTYYVLLWAVKAKLEHILLWRQSQHHAPTPRLSAIPESSGGLKGENVPGTKSQNFSAQAMLGRDGKGR